MWQRSRRQKHISVICDLSLEILKFESLTHPQLEMNWHVTGLASEVPDAGVVPSEHLKDGKEKISPLGQARHKCINVLALPQGQCQIDNCGGILSHSLFLKNGLVRCV